MNFQVGQIYKVCDEGFDFIREITKNGICKILKTNFFYEDNFKYMEIINSKKFNRTRKYKIRLLIKNKERWSLSYACKSENVKLKNFTWITSTVLNKKIELGVIEKTNWDEIAKEKLLEEIIEEE
ncbi:MAG: hypothetical protein ACOC3V_04075 [bacterium]